jgi:biofilm PGA synthesis protein PgaA
LATGNRSTKLKRMFGIVLAVGFLLFSPGILFPALPYSRQTQDKPDQVRQRHWEAVALAREGKYDEAISLLEKLLNQHPSDRSIAYDYLVVLSWAEKDDKVLEYAAQVDIVNKETPLYVLSAAAQSARRRKRYDLAIGFYRKILDRQPGHLPARVGMALNQAEKGELDTALKGLKELETHYPRNVELLSALAYVYQLRQEFFDEMSYYQRILAVQPGNRAAKQGLILSVSTLGAPGVALEMLENDTRLELSAPVLEQIKGDRAAQLVNWGESTPETETTRYRETDMALRLLEENALRAAADKTIAPRHLRRAQFDRLIALRDRIRMKDVVKAYEALVQKERTLPGYSLIPAADAYLFLSRPRKAKKLYQEVLTNDPQHFNAGLSLFYALLESEEYKSAGKHVETMARSQPTWLRLKNSRVYGKNPKKLSADFASIMFEAYARRLHKAQERMENKLVMAPYNRDIRTSLAKIYLWRGWPRKALRQLLLVLAQEPRHHEAQIWKSHALISLHKYDQAFTAVENLRDRFPEKKSVQELERDWNTHYKWHFHSEMMGGRGEGVVLGSRDFSIDNYLYTPPIHHWFKGFIHYYTHSAKFFGESANHWRWGAGIDFSRGNYGGQLELLRRLSGDPDYGFRLGGRWSMNDYWEVSADYTHNGIDIPLKGRMLDLKGNYATLNLVWRSSDRGHLKGAYTTYDFNDGNRRHAFFLGGRRCLITGPKFLLFTDAELYTSSNSLTGRYYYNPEADFSYMVSLDAWWTTYRFYDFKFVQRLVGGYGTYWQKHYHGGEMWVIRYEHHWDFNDRQALLYGISYSRRVYDGNPEYGTTFYVTIDWRF